jgi:multiple sugar transport system substrate-binding protein
MSSDVFMWDASSNNRVFLWGRASIIENGISAIRSMEKNNPELARKVVLAPPAAGPSGRLTGTHVLHCYVLWKFSDKVDLAKKFLVDLVTAADAGFRASEFYNLPCFPRAVPDLAKKLAGQAGPAKKPGAEPPLDRYALLAGADRWSACPGHPGYVTPAIDETVQRGVIPAMFARVARGDMGVEASVRTAEVEMRRIFARWAG